MSTSTAMGHLLHGTRLRLTSIYVAERSRMERAVLSSVEEQLVYTKIGLGGLTCPSLGLMRTNPRKIRVFPHLRVDPWGLNYPPNFFHGLGGSGSPFAKHALLGVCSRIRHFAPSTPRAKLARTQPLSAVSGLKTRPGATSHDCRPSVTAMPSPKTGEKP